MVFYIDIKGQRICKMWDFWDNAAPHLHQYGSETIFPQIRSLCCNKQFWNDSIRRATNPTQNIAQHKCAGNYFVSSLIFPNLFCFSYQQFIIASQFIITSRYYIDELKQIIIVNSDVFVSMESHFDLYHLSAENGESREIEICKVKWNEKCRDLRSIYQFNLLNI